MGNKEFYRKYTKSIDETKAHFIERVLERYGVALSDEDYFYLNGKFKGLYKRGNCKTIGYLQMDGYKIWCMYSSEEHLLTTALPSEVGSDFKALLRSYFGRTIMPIVLIIYEYYLNELNTVKKDFSSLKEAAIYYHNNTSFPAIHIWNFKKEDREIAKNHKLFSEIKHILHGTSKRLKLTVLQNNK